MIKIVWISKPLLSQISNRKSNETIEIARSDENFTFHKRSNCTNEEKDLQSRTPLAGRKLFDDHSSSIEEKSKYESQEQNKSKRGILYDWNQENLYIVNLNISDAEQRKLLSDTKKYKDLAEIDNGDILNLEVNNFLEAPNLFQISENDQENIESSTERAENLKSSFVNNDSKQIPSNFNEFYSNNFVSRESTSKRSGLKWRSSVKESSRYSNFDEDHENTTISKFLANIEIKYTTNNSTATKRKKIREDQVYEDDYDECKKIIDFKDASNIKETPNISSSSNIKNYSLNENEQIKCCK